MMRHVVAALGVAVAAGAALAQGGLSDPAAVESEDGKYYDAEGYPTFNIGEGGAVDFHTFSGYRRYHAECHVCHGPDGEGSTYAPALRESLTAEISYEDFVDIVTNGKQNGNSVMPAFGANPNVMCYLDDIYIYLRARAQGELPRGRPGEREDKPDAFTEAEDACMGA